MELDTTVDPALDSMAHITGLLNQLLTALGQLDDPRLADLTALLARMRDESGGVNENHD